MRDAASQPANRFHFLRLPQLIVAFPGFLVPVKEARRHVIERVSHQYGFGTAANGNAARPVARGDVARRIGDVLERPDHASAEQNADTDSDRKDRETRAEQPEPQFVHRLAYRFPVLEEDQPTAAVLAII